MQPGMILVLVLKGKPKVRITLRFIAMLATITAIPLTSAFAQNTNPGNTGGAGQIATPTYDSGKASNPALTTGAPPKTNVPAAENPTVGGATGNAIVKGDQSTISGDQRGTTQQKTGQATEGGGK
jgi:hypothetical protein